MTKQKTIEFHRMNSSPIGMFDSGIGGLSILYEINKLLPRETVIYISDKKNFPYGDKSPSQIRQIAKKNVELLLQQNAKIIVVACNTATVHAVSYLRKTFTGVEIVGVEPAVKPAAAIAKKGILVLSSPKAANSKQLARLIDTYAKGIKVFNIGSLDLVCAIEAQNSPDDALQRAVPIKLLEEIDTIVLGCTHFPLIKDDIQKFVGNNIKLIDSGEAVAKRVKFLINQNTYHFYILRSSDNSLYSGITNNLEKRLLAHRSGKGAKYLRGKLPVELVYIEEFADKSSALKREAEVKKWTKAKKELLINNTQGSF